MAISVNRYIYICKSKYYKQIFSFRNTIVICIVIWIISALIDLPNFLNWGDHRYDMKTLVCSFDRTANYNWITLFVCTGVVFPGLVVIICYINIVRFVRSHSRKIQDHREQEPGCYKDGPSRNMGHAKLSKQQKQLLKMVFAIFAVFILCWVPYGIVVLIDFQDRLSQTVHIIVWVIAHASTALDPIIYAVTNTHFQQSYRAVWGCLTRRRIQMMDTTVSDNHDSVKDKQIFKVKVAAEPIEAISTLNT
ncbi:melatonin receptor type 1B-B-like [Saccoglossus kowalevskii]|uniref:Melatonin receptor type 1B-B-like n=1 Tax=Saccoglossus kowalevskii TaxID=10224 RepID=A0ABM0M2R7_SACKO|nr:PREDICTED: melatonin receptor type 1B-B-like [Saccoglossus kowalevskii]